jgi:hypothetical protein
MKKNVIFTGLGIILLGAIIGTIVAQKAAVARVNGTEIAASDFERQLNIFTHYATVVRSSQGSTSTPDAVFTSELRRLTLDSLIEQELIRAEAEKRLGDEGLGLRVQTKINATTSTEEIADAVKTLYGVSNQDFKEAVLMPLARQEILLGEFANSTSTFESWLVSARRGASVTIYAEDLRWADGQVIKAE